VKYARKRNMMALAKDGEYLRLRTRERHQFIRFDKLKRGYENG